ncbi:hypothetical protein AAZX31_16G049000 [Glycine max]|uniref:Knottin scorpion toxin-like domain-containing protein n=2 Tax=Glycine subgen. Soja TaxID=1462606 RepID=I1MLD8_SOYBN|nr:hypothetical protein JHK86_044457 [Glycine max]KAG4940413.1 hypothetical protein JHK87_044284 [Glycine soja]KAG4951185.1 hypothetical protein JHK85_045052 [Glycine max]KAG5101069.1 hypothetical protein JHK82_046121 [Glycine max]KAG5107658.1 hypothetical protein JHK84_044565 [Glycine max]
MASRFDQALLLGIIFVAFVLTSGPATVAQDCGPLKCIIGHNDFCMQCCRREGFGSGICKNDGKYTRCSCT